MDIDLVWMGSFAELPPDPYEPGWAFFGGPWANSVHLSNHYKAHVARVRKPICVILPVRSNPGYGTGFCIDSCPTGEPDEQWGVEVAMDSLVVGQKPLITTTPSINCLGIYHGFIQNGVLTADLGS